MVILFEVTMRACIVALAFLSVVSSRALANTLVPQKDIPITMALNYFAKLEATKKISDVQRETYETLKLGRKLFKIQSITIENRLAQDAELARIGIWNLRNAFRDAIDKNPDWKKNLSPSQKKLIQERTDILKQQLEPNSYEWAWFTFQLGNSEEAKSILEKDFNGAYDAFMAEKRNYIYGWSRPLEREEYLYRAIKVVAPLNERPPFDKKWNEMQEHLKSLNVQKTKF